MFNMHLSLSRRSMLGGLTALGAAGALAACDQSGTEQASTGVESKKATDKIDELLDYNPQPAENLDKGGTLTMTVASLGPNYNVWANAGNNVDTSDLYASIDRASVWSSKADGTPVLNKDFCENAEYTDGDKPKITYTLNPKAQYNDGTPFDWHVFENQWKMLNGSDPEIDVVSTDGYDRIESVTKGKDDREVIVTMKEVFQPWTDLYSGILAPHVNTKEIFNDGFINDMHPDWTCGPFKLEKLDTTQKRVTVVPNEKWWGAAPVLDRIVYTQMEDQATIPAFKNGEIDLTGAGTAERYASIQGTENMEIRRSQRTSVSGLNFNTTKGALKDPAVRKAIYQCIDRSALSTLRFNGLNWSEEQPGSWMLMPFNPVYQDNYPAKFDVEAAKKTLEDAGYTAGSDGKRTKDGKALTVSIVTFGDDPTFNAVYQTAQKQMTAVGIDAQIDAKGSGDFNKVMEERSFELVFMAYTVGADPTGVVNQFFNSKSSSNMTGTGSAEIDKLIPTASVSPEIKERAKIANDIEKKFQELFPMMPLFNGPSIMAVKTGLANYGPKLYLTTDWSLVGWEKGHKQG